MLPGKCCGTLAVVNSKKTFKNQVLPNVYMMTNVSMNQIFSWSVFYQRKELQENMGEPRYPKKTSKDSSKRTEKGLNA